MRFEVQRQNPRTPAIKASLSQKVNLFGASDREVFIRQLIRQQNTACELNSTCCEVSQVCL